jgi:anaerobic selenocysteine-containing dehydrogenase
MKNDGETVVKSACRMCHGVCGALVHIREGRVVKVTGDPDCPTSNGYICPKGRASVELLYHPDRLKYPLKRVGARGENKWQKISWDEALDTTAEKLLKAKSQFGAESIVGANGTARANTIFFKRFLNALGTPNNTGGQHCCYFPKLAASRLTCGSLPRCDYFGFGGVTPKCVVLWGCNIPESGSSDGMCGYQLTQTVKRGAKLIVIDPRRIRIASKATHWLQIRPGTDCALALAMLHTIIDEELYDKDFVANWTVGFDKLRERLVDYSPEKVADVSWVLAEAIRAAARTYATTKPACIQWGVALDQNINTFQVIRAILILSGITGNIDVPGGDVFFVPPANLPEMNPGIMLPEKMTPEIKARKIGAEQYRVLSDILMPYNFLDAVISGKPYLVKALFLMGHNMLVCWADTLRVAQALHKIDFIVAVDLFMTPTVQMADIVLPASSWLENDDLSGMLMGWCALGRQKVATIGECRDDKQIIIDLAHRMGMEDCFPWKNVRKYCDWILKDTGITFEEFKKLGIIKGEMRYRKYEEKGFGTPSGKFEIQSSIVESLGYDPLPFYTEPPESPYSTPELFEIYPLIITTGARMVGYFHSEGRQIKSLRKLNPDPLLDIHPDTAKNLGIEEGDWVWIENTRGRIKLKARLTDVVHPGVVNAPHCWWFPEKGPPDYGYKDSNVNMLSGGMAVDPHTGSESWRSFLCKVYKT